MVLDTDREHYKFHHMNIEFTTDKDGKEQVIEGFPKRPEQLNKTGKPVEVKLNTFNVLSYPSKSIWQYDVSITT